MAEEISEHELVERFRAMFGQRFPKTLTAKRWADAYGFSQSYVSDVLNGKRGVADRLSDALGYERRVTFVRKAP